MNYYTNEYTNGYMNEDMNECMSGYMKEYMTEYMNAYMDEYMHGYMGDGGKTQANCTRYTVTRLILCTRKFASGTVYVQPCLLYRLRATPPSQPHPAPCVFRSRY